MIMLVVLVFLRSRQHLEVLVPAVDRATLLRVRFRLDRLRRQGRVRPCPRRRSWLGGIVAAGRIVVVMQALLVLEAACEALEHRVLVAAHAPVFAADPLQLAGQAQHIARVGEGVFVVDEAVLALQEQLLLRA